MRSERKTVSDRGEKKPDIVALARVALCCATVCVTSVITLPLPFTPIPLTLGLFGILLTALLLRPGEAAAAIGAFLALGFVGLPVFSGFQGGPGVFVSYTGGFLMGYLPCALCACVFVYFLDRKAEKQGARLAIRLCGAFLGVCICYACGLLQYVFLTKTEPAAAFSLTILPFIPLDCVKILAAALLSLQLKKIPYMR